MRLQGGQGVPWDPKGLPHGGSSSYGGSSSDTVYPATCAGPGTPQSPWGALGLLRLQGPGHGGGGGRFCLGPTELNGARGPERSGKPWIFRVPSHLWGTRAPQGPWGALGPYGHGAPGAVVEVIGFA